MSVARDPFDTLTDAFLGAPRARTPRALLLVGHLPVMSGLWLSQYADREARDRGPVCMLRIEHDAVQVELLRAGSRRPVIRPQASLEDALRAIAPIAAAWFIVPRSSDTVELPQGADDVVILTGADDAAVVAAYRLVKQCVEQPEGVVPSSISVAVLGADDVESARVAEKLDKTTQTFLKVELPVRGGLQRVAPVESSFRGTFDAPTPSVSDLFRLIEAAEQSASAAQAPAAEPTPSTRAERFAPRAERVPPRVRGDAPIPISTVRPKPATRSTVAVEEVAQAMIAARAAVAQVASTSRPTVAFAPKPAPSAVAGVIPPRPAVPGVARAVAGELPARLATLLEGLEPLAFSMPRNNAVELAVDAAGRLHVVARTSDLAAALRASIWARDHAEILALAHEGLSCADPAIDLVAPSMAEAAPIDGATVHVLTLVELDGRRGHLVQTLAS